MYRKPYRKLSQLRSRRFTRRSLLIGSIQGLSLFALLRTLYSLQIVQHERYRTLSDKNRITVKPIIAGRGIIFDRAHVIIATIRKDYHITLERTNPTDMRQALTRLERLIPIPVQEKRRLLQAFKKEKRRKSFLIAKYIDWDQLARISVHIAELPGISVAEGKSRFYTTGSTLCHVLGHVGKSKDINVLENEKIGVSGMEKQFDAQLRGRKGTRRVEVDAHGREIRNLDISPAQRGQSLTLSLDARLQSIATARMNDKTGSVVVLDCHSGEVLAMVSSPGFDPNAFSRGLTTHQWRDLNEDSQLPLLNRATAGQYAPGSTFKMIVALAALESGAVEPYHSVFCPGHLDFSGRRFHCWKRHGHGHVDLAKALRESCDVYFYQAALKVGVSRIADISRRFGLGKNWRQSFPGSTSGLVPDPAWKKRTLGQGWFEGETLITGIGQGYLLTTPLQLALMTGSIVNGGFALAPRFTMAKTDEPPAPSRRSLEISPHFQGLVMRSMEDVVNHPRGTAYGSRIADEDWRMGGKTGTSQVRRITQEERDNAIDKSRIPRHLRDHALFVGYVPLEKPRYVAAAIVEHGGSGSKVAAPIVRDVLQATRSTFQRGMFQRGMSQKGMDQKSMSQGDVDQIGMDQRGMDQGGQNR